MVSIEINSDECDNTLDVRMTTTEIPAPHSGE